METISIYARYVIEDGTQVGYKLGAKVKNDVEADLHEKYGIDHADTAYQCIEVVTNDPAIRDLASRVDWEFLYDGGSNAIGMVIHMGNKDADKLIKVLWLHITHAMDMFGAADMVKKHICIIYGSVAEAVRAWVICSHRKEMVSRRSKTRWRAKESIPLRFQMVLRLDVVRRLDWQPPPSFTL